MLLRTRLRLILVPLYFLMLLVFLTVPFSLFIKNIAGIEFHSKDGSSTIWAELLVSSVCLGTAIFITYRAVTRLLFIQFSIDDNSIVFQYPLLFRKKVYSFDEMLGFRFSKYYSRACYYKKIIFKTKDDKEYTLSDLETRNLREIEAFAIANFKLKGDLFKDLSRTDIDEVLFRNKQFDIKQAKDYRETSYLGLLIIVTILLVFVFKTPGKNIEAIGLLLGIPFSAFLIGKIIKANKTISALSSR